ncbi:hypothetical protein BT69DRAFT_1316542 [Atractiella rhizophila]|nr:hypothetical protein BT69DRAFT_1316542 [Atractiella rhizophila]
MYRKEVEHLGRVAEDVLLDTIRKKEMRPKRASFFWKRSNTVLVAAEGTTSVLNTWSPSFIPPFHSHVPCEAIQSLDNSHFTTSRPSKPQEKSYNVPKLKEIELQNMPPAHFYNPDPKIINRIDASLTAFTPHLPLPGQDVNTSPARNVQDRAWGEGKGQHSWTAGVSSEEIAASSNEGDESPEFDGSPEEQSFHAQLASRFQYHPLSD